jgi:hypothetical protein
MLSSALFVGLIPSASAYVPAVHEQWSAVRDTFSGTCMHTARLQAIGPDGTTDSVNVIFHARPNGDVDRFDLGSCAY